MLLSPSEDLLTSPPISLSPTKKKRGDYFYNEFHMFLLYQSGHSLVFTNASISHENLISHVENLTGMVITYGMTVSA